ncbi:MAG TPA: hypothetical protein VLM87_14820 [Rubrivivax sp.]|nr:hypothetical protein [Rubrivivax sp.]
MSSRPDPDDAELAQALQASRALEDAPEPLIQRAIGLWQPRTRPAAGAARGVLRQLVATLGFDSAGLTPAAAGMRSASASAPGAANAPRQLLFTAEGLDIDLRIASAVDGRHWQLSGQVLGPDEAGTALLRCGEQLIEVAWNELAEFHFDDVPAGSCTLTLRAADWELELPPLDLTR